MVLQIYRFKRKGLEQLINTHDLVIQNNSTPTFIYSDNILDLMLSSKEISSRIDNYNTNNSITSDHLMITANLKCDISLEKQTYEIIIPNWTKYSEFLKVNYINTQERELITIEEKVQYIEGEIIKAYENTKIRIKKNNKIKVLPPHIIKIIQEKRKLRKRFMIERTQQIKTN